jgi:threonine dehydrogenase-like Zn-dependent dehydrogenase
MADLFVVPAHAAWIIPSGMSLLEASLVEPLATGVHAARLAGGVQGKAVVIIGGGTIGLGVLAACLAQSATVVMSEPQRAKRDVALRWGAAGAIDPREGDPVESCRALLPHRPDVVFDCVGRPETVASAIRMATRAGTVVVVGAEHGTMPLPLQTVQDFEVHILGSSMYVESDITSAVDLTRERAGQIRACVTAEYPITQAAEAFERAVSGQEIKVQLIGEATE